MRRVRSRILATVVIALSATIPAMPAHARATPAATAAETTVAPSGQGHAVADTVDVRDLPPPAAASRVRSQPRPALGRDGRPTGDALPATLPYAPKPGAGQKAQRATVSTAVAPSTVNANFDGINQNVSGGWSPSDVNAAVGSTQILESVNQRFAVYTKTGTQLCATDLPVFFNRVGQSVFDPRVIWDNVNNRFVMIAAVNTGTPTLLIAATQTADACGSWYRYAPTFSGTLFPAGSFLDYPYLGQDRNALLFSSNNFSSFYLGSAAFSVSKAAVYSGGTLTFPTFSVDFSTAPVTVGGIPIATTTNSYFLAGVPGTGYRLYRMTNSAGPGTTLTLQTTVSSPYQAPARRVNQCGTTATLDPLDGRIQWQPMLAGNRIWFTHGTQLGSFPGIRYGFIDATTNALVYATAFHSGRSDDFNPSIAAHQNAGGQVYVFLNWAFTENDPPGTCTFTSMTVDGINGVTPGTSVPHLIGAPALVNGSVTGQSRFGDYSSVAIDPVAAGGACAAGQTAVAAQQYFAPDGSWNTRIARVSYC